MEMQSNSSHKFIIINISRNFSNFHIFVIEIFSESIQYNLTNDTYATLEAVDYNFLILYIGEYVNIINSTQDWCYGNKEGDESVCGLFPRSAVFLLPDPSLWPFSREAQEIILELNETLEEWWISIKETYGKQARIGCQDDVLLFMEDLMVMRKKILSGNVPIEELKDMRLQLAKKIDLGNQWLGLDMIIRDETGRSIDLDSVSVVQIFRAHITAAEKILNDSKPSDIRVVNAFSLLVHAQSATVDCKSECEFSLSLYDSTDQKFISENFIFYWSPQIGALSNRSSKALFIDLGSKEYPSFPASTKTHRIFLCIRVSRIAPIDPSSATMKKVFDAGPPQLWSRQPYAAALLDLSDIFDRPVNDHIVPLNREDTLEQLIAKARSTNSMKISNGENSAAFGRSKLMLSTEILIGSLTEIKKSNLHIFSINPPVEVKKMYFADVISCDESRNDLYLTLLHGDFHGGKGSDKNIEARVSVVDSNGVVNNSIEICTADGTLHRSTYHSLVFYHEDKPKWNETIKIQIPDEADQNVHLRITFHFKKSYDKTKQEKGPFALAFARIMEGSTLIGDGTHELLVYKIEPGKFDINDITYTRLPATRNELKASQSQMRPQTTTFIYYEKNYIIIQTITCSTTLTHNKNLLDILQWKANRGNLKLRLEEISKSKGIMVSEEIVKFIPNFCDVLFEIMDQYSDYDELIFDSLIFVIQLVCEERYKNFRIILQKYVENFHSTIAFAKLMPLLQKRIENAEETHEWTLSTIKSLGILMQIIVKSKRCSDRLGVTQADFHQLMAEFLNAVILFLRNKRVRMTCQNTALKYLPTIFPHVCSPDIYSPQELTAFLVNILDHINGSISPRYRLNFIREIIQSNLFLEGHNRCHLLPKVLDKVLEELDDIVSQTPNIDRHKIEDCVVTCADIIFDIFDRLFRTNSQFENGSEDELCLIISKVFRSIVQTSIYLINEKIVFSTFAALLAVLLNKMSAQMYKIYVDGLHTRIDKHDFLMELLHLFRDLINRSPFSSSWFYMIYLLNKTILKTLKFIMQTIVEQFYGIEFDLDLWREYMLTMVTFSCQKSLQIGSLPTTKRSRYLSSQLDLRKIAVADLRSMWFRLSMKDKGIFIPFMVGSFLQVALIDDDVVRETVIPIFFDMLQCEFLSHPFRDFSRFANEMIIQLDCLVDEDRGDLSFKEQLKRIMLQMCSTDPELKTEGCRFVHTIDTLLKHLFEYREVRTNAYCIENGMDRTVQLLKYYDAIGQHDLYISYVYKLYDLHMLSNSKVEAAYTLLKHGETLTWEDRELSPALLSAHLNRHCGTHRQLKEALYTEVANLFDEKEMWEDAISILKEIKRLADLYHKISAQSRVGFTFYLVGFYGLDFPVYLNNQQYIYRGNECEAISSFQHRMLSTFPGTELVTSMDDCSHLSEKSGRYLQIFPVQTYCENKPQKKCANRLICWYWKNNRIENFEYCKGQFRKGTKWTELEDSEIMRSWVIRRFVKSVEPLPNILKWSLVASISEPIEYSPLMEAVRTMQRNNDELEEMAHVVFSTPLESVVPLGGKIRGIVQAFVQGGIKNYKVFFTEECKAVLNQSERELVLQLEALIKNQIPILEFSLYVHASREHQIDLQFHESLAQSFNEYKISVEERFGKIPSQLPPGCSIHISHSHKNIEERKMNNFDSSISPTVMSITGVFRRGGGLYNTKSGRNTPKKSSRGDIKSTTETSSSKRISSSSDHSMDSVFNDLNNGTPRSTLDLSRFEHSFQSPSSLSSYTGDGHSRHID
ncbi:unnamed protein product [Dracunculus medinensis]|uniref:Dedicator of cytokinesis protein 1 n=1 Tax=Dracunculus medinensis TaxID=318479 RepID=A0A158Q4H1_DRAME|nr:unnamed protein product [Dracunculus medinensis]